VSSDGRIYFSPSEQVKKYLNELTKMGIYGKQRGDVINHILGSEIMRQLETGTLKRLPPEQEAAVKEDE
jgi:hypothetical protein